jgi:hypothetical protein
MENIDNLMKITNSLEETSIEYALHLCCSKIGIESRVAKAKANYLLH